MTAALRIAMWSGPRNISTAMMRAWENRGDCVVSDEPLYAHYLAATGVDHPGREEVIAAGDTDWRAVVNRLTAPIPDGKPIWYQKHMCHHLLPGMDHEWIFELSNVLLIRDPTEVVASYLRTRDEVSAEAIGIPQQRELFDRLCERTGTAPLVIDAGRFLQSPESQLRAVCRHFGIEFTSRMLDWPPGPRASDGVWAPYWYHRVWASTGFARPGERVEKLSTEAQRVVEACRSTFEYLRGFSIAA